MTIGFDASRSQLDERAGPENYTYNLLRELFGIDQDNFYRLYIQPPASDFLPALRPCLPAGRFQTTNNFELIPIGWPRLWTQGGLALECLRRPPDVLFIPAHTIPVVRRPGLKTVVTIHDVGFQKFLEQYQYRWWRLYGGRISNYAARAATHVIAVSQSTKRDLIEQLGADPDKITVIYEGVDHSRFAPNLKSQISNLKTDEVKRKYGIGGEYLLFVGTIQPRKNLVRLVEAFSTINYQLSTIKLVIAGKRGWSAEEIYEAPKKFGVGDRVKFLGYVPTDDIVLLMNGALAFVFPSLYEGFGLPALEALACGCPVVTSNISSLPEVVGEAGILVDPYSVEDIARGITEVLRLSTGQRQILVKKGIEQARKFTWEKTARETLEVFRQVFHDRGKNTPVD